MHCNCTEEKNSTKVKVSKQIYSQELHKNEGRLLWVWIFSDFHFYVIPENLKVQSLCLLDREFDLVNRYYIAYFSRFRTRTISNLHIYSTKKTYSTLKRKKSFNFVMYISPFFLVGYCTSLFRLCIINSFPSLVQGTKLK